jgi:hypothetical protein
MKVLILTSPNFPIETIQNVIKKLGYHLIVFYCGVQARDILRVVLEDTCRPGDIEAALVSGDLLDSEPGALDTLQKYFIPVIVLADDRHFPDEKTGKFLLKNGIASVINMADTGPSEIEAQITAVLDEVKKRLLRQMMASVDKLHVASRIIRENGEAGFSMVADLVGSQTALGMLIMNMTDELYPQDGTLPDADNIPHLINEKLLQANIFT